jgi:hypothetical protein
MRIRTALPGISGVHMTPFDAEDRIEPEVLAGCGCLEAPAKRTGAA